MNEQTKEKNLAPVFRAIVILLALEITVRFVAEFDLRRILVLETASFLAMAVFIFAFTRRRSRLSHRARITLFVLAATFALGAARSGLWAAGIDVYQANLFVLSIGLLALIAGIWRGRVHRRKR